MKIHFEQVMASLRASAQALRIPVYTAPGKDARGVDGRLVAHTDKMSSIAEQYRILQTDLYALAGEKKLKTIAITSSQDNEGKTVTSCNLALTLASDMSKRVVLVDADMRKPDVHALLNIKREPGLSDILRGACDASGVLKSPAVDNLFVLPAGSAHQNPSELLQQSQAKGLFDKLRDSFDYAIIDTPPVTPVSDSRIVGALCDAVIMVVRSDYASKKTIRESFWLLETAHVKPLACILTDFHPPFYRNAKYSPYL